MPDRPNFFELLDLDPAIDDWTVIEKRIREKQDVWARDLTMGSAGKRQKAKQGMDLLREIREVMQDPVRRREQADAALQRRRDTYAAKERELAEWIELLQVAGSCSPDQLEKIRCQLAGIFSETEIRERLQSAGIRVDAGPGGPKPPWERLDPATAVALRRHLEQAGITSLYELLGLPPSSTPAALSARADEIYKENQRLGHTDAVTTARNALAGIAKTLFRSEEEKRKYDTHRVLEVLDGLKDQIDAAGSNGILTAQQLDTLVRLAAQRGAPAEEARELLEECAAARGWRIDRAAAPSPAPTPAGPAAAGGTPDPGKAGEEEEPPAPNRLIVRPVQAGFRLSWDPVRAPGDLRYRVLRKADSVPWDEGDGELIASTPATQADDTAVMPGISWYYAVFTLRAGLASSVPAYSGPHLSSAAGIPPLGAAASSQKLGGLPVRRLTAAATLLLVLGGAGALVYEPSLLTAMGQVWGGSPATQTPQPGPPGPGPVGGHTASAGGAPGSATASAPSGTSSAAGAAAAASPQGAAAGNSAVLPVAVPGPLQTVPVGGGSVAASGGSRGASGVLGDSSSSGPVSPGHQQASSLPEEPEVTVIAVGDPLLATAVEDGLIDALRGQGLNIVSGLSTLDELRQDSRPSVGRILSSLQGEGVHAVVIARVERLADRELNYYGRRDVASVSNLRIDAYLVGGSRSLGSGWGEQIEYTAINASSEGRSAAHRAASDLSAAVREGWSAHRGAGAP